MDRSMWDDMPPAIERAQSFRGGGGGFIPPPENARREEGGYNPFPGAPPSSSPWPTASTAWPQSPWAATQQLQPATAQPWPQQGRYPPTSPYDYTPSPSWGGATPASWGPSTPISGFDYPPTSGQEPALGQPITASPWFNGGMDLSPDPRWPDRQGRSALERRGTKQGPSPAFGEFPLERSRSHDAAMYGMGGGRIARRASEATGQRRSRSRSRKTSGNLQPFSPHQALLREEYSAHNLARRPPDWRPDYDPPRTGFAAYIPRVQKAASNVPEFRDLERRVVHDNLAYKPQDTAIFYDLRFPPDSHTLEFPQLGRPYNHIDFAQLATNPPIHSMRLFHPLLPWYIDVVETLPNGITIQDVIWQMHLQLDVPITSRHFYNKDLEVPIQKRIWEEFMARTDGNAADQVKGVKRIDYMQGMVIFEGLVRTKNGHWEMKTRMREE